MQYTHTPGHEPGFPKSGPAAAGKSDGRPASATSAVGDEAASVRSTQRKAKESRPAPKQRSGGERNSAGPGASAPLGNTEIIQNHEVRGSLAEDFSDAERWSRQLWTLQRTMWRVTENPRFAGCQRWKAPGSAGGHVIWQGQGSARWGGLQDSHSVWSSPVSSVKIAGQRQLETSRALTTWTEQESHQALFLTLTLRHHAGQSLQELWDAISKCWDAITNSPAWRGNAKMVGDKTEFGIEHYIKATEVTHGRNGWHVHLHVLLLVSRELNEDQVDRLRARLLQRWTNRAVKIGLEAPSSDRGIDLKLATTSDDAEKMASYLVKGQVEGLDQSSVSHELASGMVSKGGRNGNRTPFQVLEQIAEKETPRDLAIWQEWERVSVGRRQLTWSRGCKADLGVDELTDAEISEAEDQEKDRVVVARVVAEHWSAIQSKTDTRLDVTNLTSRAADPVQAQRFAAQALRIAGVVHESVMIPLEQFLRDTEEAAEDRSTAETMIQANQRENLRAGFRSST